MFLWARLVVTDLLHNLRDGDGVKELSKVLDEIPPDLTNQFRRMLESIQPTRRREASMMFQIALHEEEYFKPGNSLRLLDMSFTSETDTDFSLSWASGQGTFHLRDRESILFHLDSTIRKLNSRSLGLLECFYYPGETARFLSEPADDYEPTQNLKMQSDDLLSGAAFHPLIQGVAASPQHRLFAFDFGIDFLHRSLRDFLSGEGLRLLEQYTDGPFDSRAYLRNARLILQLCAQHTSNPNLPRSILSSNACPSSVRCCQKPRNRGRLHTKLLVLGFLPELVEYREQQFPDSCD